VQSGGTIYVNQYKLNNEFLIKGENNIFFKNAAQIGASYLLNLP